MVLDIGLHCWQLQPRRVHELVLGRQQRRRDVREVQLAVIDLLEVGRVACKQETRGTSKRTDDVKRFGAAATDALDAAATEAADEAAQSTAAFVQQRNVHSFVHCALEAVKELRDPVDAQHVAPDVALIGAS